MVKKTISVYIVFFLMMVFCIPAFASNYVEDSHQAFNQQQRASLEKASQSIDDKFGYGVYVLSAGALANPEEYSTSYLKKHPEIKDGLLMVLYSTTSDGQQKYYLHPVYVDNMRIPKAELAQISQKAEAVYSKNPQTGLHAFAASLLSDIDQTLTQKKSSQNNSEPAVAEESGVYLHDQLSLFDVGSAVALEERLRSLSQKFPVNVMVLTSADLGGNKDAQTMADRYVLERVDPRLRENIILLFLYVNGNDKSVGASTKGEGILYMTDKRINTLLDMMTPELKKGNYTTGLMTGVNQIEANLDEGIPAEKAKKPKGLTPFEGLLGLLPAGLGAFLVRRRIQVDYSEKGAQDPYDVDQFFRPVYRTNQKRLVDQSVSYEARSTNSNKSTTHQTDGESFGGGSRKF